MSSFRAEKCFRFPRSSGIRPSLLLRVMYLYGADHGLLTLGGWAKAQPFRRCPDYWASVGRAKAHFDRLSMGPREGFLEVPGRPSTPGEVAMVGVMGWVQPGWMTLSGPEPGMVVLPADRPAEAPCYGLIAQGGTIHVFLEAGNVAEAIKTLLPSFRQCVEEGVSKLRWVWHIFTEGQLMSVELQECLRMHGIPNDHAVCFWHLGGNALVAYTMRARMRWMPMQLYPTSLTAGVHKTLLPDLELLAASAEPLPSVNLRALSNAWGALQGPGPRAFRHSLWSLEGNLQGGELGERLAESGHGMAQTANLPNPVAAAEAPGKTLADSRVILGAVLAEAESKEPGGGPALADSSGHPRVEIGGSKSVDRPRRGALQPAQNQQEALQELRQRLQLALDLGDLQAVESLQERLDTLQAQAS